MKKIILIIALLSPINIYALTTNSSNYIMYNLTDNTVVYEKDAYEEIYIASLTKIATAIAVIENVDNLETTYTLPQEVFNGLIESNASVAGFKLGQSVTIKDLLYGLMLPSGADASNALQIYLESNNIFLVEEMNNIVKQLGLTNTTFTNTSGLDDTENQNKSSAYDIANILMYALENEDFYELYTAQKYLTNDKTITFKSTLSFYTENYEIENNYIIGSKTGYTNNAGLCFSSISNFDNMDFLLITAGADPTTKTGHIIDTLSIYEYIDQNFKYRDLFSEGDILGYITTIDSKVLQYNIIADTSYQIYTKNGFDKSEYTYRYTGKEELSPSITTGDNIGVLDVLYKDSIIYSMDVTYDGTLEYTLEGFITNNIEVIAYASGGFILFCITLSFLIKQKKKRK